MKKIIFFSLLFVSCNSFKPGSYRSYCIAYGQTIMISKFKEDSTFTYQFLYSDEIINGKWKKSNDTLILKSEIFMTKRDSLSPIIKNSDLDGEDRYVVKNSKLYIINKVGKTEDCYLYKYK